MKLSLNKRFEISTVFWGMTKMRKARLFLTSRYLFNKPRLNANKRDITGIFDKKAHKNTLF